MRWAVVWLLVAAVVASLSCAHAPAAAPSWEPVTLGGVVVAKAYVPPRSEAQPAAGGGVVAVRRPEAWLLIVTTRVGGLRLGVTVDAFLALREGDLVVIEGEHQGNQFRARSVQRLHLETRPTTRSAA